MWLPAPIYESLPYLYVLSGILFISGTVYIELSAPGALLYLGCGIVSLVYGTCIFKLRVDARRSATQQFGPESA